METGSSADVASIAGSHPMGYQAGVGKTAGHGPSRKAYRVRSFSESPSARESYLYRVPGWNSTETSLVAGNNLVTGALRREREAEFVPIIHAEPSETGFNCLGNSRTARYA